MSKVWGGGRWSCEAADFCWRGSCVDVILAIRLARAGCVRAAQCVLLRMRHKQNISKGAEGSSVQLIRVWPIN